VVFWWGDMDSVRRYVTARGHVMQEHLETDAHALLDQSLHWCHFAVRPTLFMLSAPGSVFLVFELAACGGRARERPDVRFTFSPSLGADVVCAGDAAPVDFPTVGGPRVGSTTKGGKCERVDLGEGRSAYRVRLVGLTPGQEYSYQIDVGSRGRDGVTLPSSSLPAYRFHTSRPFRACRGKDQAVRDVVENFRAFIIADVQSGAAVFRRAAERISETMRQDDDADRPEWKGVGVGCGDLLVHVGDSVQSPQIVREWHAYFLGPLEEGHVGQSLPMLFARGNHDVDGWHGDDPRKHPVQIYTPGEQWQSYHTGVFSGGEHENNNNGIFWIVLDSNHDSDASQLEFLRAQLRSEACSRALFRIVVVHIAPFVEYWDPNTWARGENKWGQDVRLKFAPLFEKYGVDLVVSGHSHIYQRGSGAPTTLLREEGSASVTYVVCGGGGAELESELFNHVEDYGFYTVTSAQYHYLEVVMRGCGRGGEESLGVLESNHALRSTTLQVPRGGTKKLRRRRGGGGDGGGRTGKKGKCRLDVTVTNPVTGANVDRFTLDARERRAE
jgi:hypothetical protein